MAVVGTMADVPPIPPYPSRDLPTGRNDFDPNTNKAQDRKVWDMTGIINGNYDFLVEKNTPIKPAGYPGTEYDRLNPLKCRKNWFNQQS